MKKIKISTFLFLFCLGLITNLLSQNSLFKLAKPLQNSNNIDYSYLHYDNGIMSMGYGLTSGGTFYCASYWPSSTMNKYANAYITDILIAIGDTDAESFTLYFWDENTSSSPGSVIYTQQFFPNEWSWNTISLTTPLVISGNDLWVGYKVQNHPSGDYSAGIDAGPAIAGFGDMWSLDGINFESIQNSYGHDYNFNILVAVDYDYNMPSGTGNSFSDCHFDFYDDGGQGVNYSNNFYGVTTIYPWEPSTNTKIVFNFIGTESDVDVLNIYDGNSTFAPLIASLSGVSLFPPSFESTALDGSLTFEFITNESDNGNGWSARLYCVNKYPPINLSQEVYCQIHNDYISYGETKLFEIYMLTTESYNFSCCYNDFCCGGLASGDADFRMLDVTYTELWNIDGESTCNYDATTYGTDYEDWSPPADGYYYLEISEKDQYPLTFDLAYKKKGIQLMPTSDCQILQGSFGPGEGTWYGLSLYSSESYNFSTCNSDICPGDADGNTDLSLFDESGSLIWKTEGSENCDYHASTYGTIYENWYPPDDGCYLLFLDENGTGTNTITYSLSYETACAAPSELQATNMTQTSADLIWSENGDATSWDIEIGLLGFIPAGIPTHPDILSIPYNWNEGTSNTSYDFYVRAHCGGGEFSGWIGPYTFATICDPFTIPIYEGFDGVTEPEIPECWFSLVGANTTYGVIRTEDYQYVSPPNSIRLYVGSDLSASLYIISPQIYDDLSNQMVFFQTKTSSSLNESFLIVGTMSNPFDEGTFHPFLTIDLTNNFEEHTIYFNTSVGSDSFLAFKNGSINHLYDSYYIDDINVLNKPSCPPPQDQSAVIVSSSTADLYWTENGDAALWEIEYGESGFIQGTGTIITNISSIPYSLTGLTSGNAYDWYVRSNCGGGEFSTWTGPATFVQVIIPSNDECLNAIPIPEPYPQTVNGTTIGATEDCLSFPTVWYEAFLPYDQNDIEISFCPTSDNLGIDIIGAVFKYAVDCNCNLFDYNVYDWNLCTGTAPTYWFYDVAGPNTIFLPIIIQTYEASGLFETNFSFNINITEGGGCDINTFPYSESFETGIGGWHQISGDDFNWTRYTGSTPSSTTGPSTAYDGSYYLYLESSSPNYPNKTAGLVSEFCFATGGIANPQIDFAYHMYGSTMGSLTLQVSTNDGVSWDDLWSISGDHGNSWFMNSINLSEYADLDNVLIRFWGETGSSYFSDMAIDDFSISEGFLPGESCSNPQDLSTLTSPYSATTLGYANDFSFCAMGSAPDRIFFIDVPNGNTADIWQSSNNFNSTHAMRYSGACPGSVEISCVDDDDYTPISWENLTGSTERVWFIVSGYNSDYGDFTLEWTLIPTSVPVCNGDIDIDGAGTTTWNYPLSTYYHDARTTTIYLASEFECAGGNITSMQYYVSTVPGQEMNAFTIRMKHIASDSYSSANFETSGWTTVYQAIETISTIGWHTFNFTTPFSFNGIDNLEVDVCYNNDSYSTDGDIYYFDGGANRSKYYRCDGCSFPTTDPLTWTSAGTLSTNVPRVLFTFESTVTLDLKAYLEGPFNGSDMNTDLSGLTDFPKSQPYNTLPWNYSGDESVVSVPSGVVDWMFVELRDASNAGSAIAGTMIAQQACFLLSDGSVVDLDGTSNLQFDVSISQQLFVVVWNRNHLGVLSAYPLTEISGIYSYDFSTAAGQAYNSGQKNMGGVYGMNGGDANPDNIVDDLDKTGSWMLEVGLTGYLNSDLNFDGQSNNVDKNDIWQANYNVQGEVP